MTPSPRDRAPDEPRRCGCRDAPNCGHTGVPEQRLAEAIFPPAGTEEPAWRGTGQKQLVPGNTDRVPKFDPRAGDHLWIIMSVHRWNPDTETPMLDMENLLTIQGPGCYHCEQPYTPRLASRRCKGHP